jgi:hypothetical protein
MSEIQSERLEMSASDEASEIMRGLAEPAPAGAHIETLIRNVARKVGFTFVRAKAIWYREARLIRAEEMDALRTASKKRGSEVVRLQYEYAAIIQRIKRLEEALGQANED